MFNKFDFNFRVYFDYSLLDYYKYYNSFTFKLIILKHNNKTISLKNYIILKIDSFYLKISNFFTNWVLSTNHRRIAIMYFIFTIISGFTGLILATIIRIELAYPGQSILFNNAEKYLTIISLHGIIMVFFMIIPILFGAFGNFLLPTQLGIRDVAFPRLNSFMFWVTPSGFVMLLHIILFDKSYNLTYWLNYSELRFQLRRRFYLTKDEFRNFRNLSDNSSLSLRFKKFDKNFYNVKNQILSDINYKDNSDYFFFFNKNFSIYFVINLLKEYFEFFFFTLNVTILKYFDIDLFVYNLLMLLIHKFPFYINLYYLYFMNYFFYKLLDNVSNIYNKLSFNYIYNFNFNFFFKKKYFFYFKNKDYFFYIDRCICNTYTHAFDFDLLLNLYKIHLYNNLLEDLVQFHKNEFKLYYNKNNFSNLNNFFLFNNVINNHKSVGHITKVSRKMSLFEHYMATDIVFSENTIINNLVYVFIYFLRWCLEVYHSWEKFCYNICIFNFNYFGYYVDHIYNIHIFMFEINYLMFLIDTMFNEHLFLIFNIKYFFEHLLFDSIYLIYSFDIYFNNINIFIINFYFFELYFWLFYLDNITYTLIFNLNNILKYLINLYFFIYLLEILNIIYYILGDLWAFFNYILFIFNVLILYIEFIFYSYFELFDVIYNNNSFISTDLKDLNLDINIFNVILYSIFDFFYFIYFIDYYMNIIIVNYLFKYFLIDIIYSIVLFDFYLNINIIDFYNIYIIDFDFLLILLGFYLYNFFSFIDSFITDVYFIIFLFDIICSSWLDIYDSFINFIFDFYYIINFLYLSHFLFLNNFLLCDFNFFLLIIYKYIKLFFYKFDCFLNFNIYKLVDFLSIDIRYMLLWFDVYTSVLYFNILANFYIWLFSNYNMFYDNFNFFFFLILDFHFIITFLSFYFILFLNKISFIFFELSFLLFYIGFFFDITRIYVIFYFFINDLCCYYFYFMFILSILNYNILSILNLLFNELILYIILPFYDIFDNLNYFFYRYYFKNFIHRFIPKSQHVEWITENLDAYMKTLDDLYFNRDDSKKLNNNKSVRYVYRIKKKKSKFSLFNYNNINIDGVTVKNLFSNYNNLKLKNYLNLLDNNLNFSNKISLKNLKLYIDIYVKTLINVDYFLDWRELRLERDIWRSVDDLSIARRHWNLRKKYFSNFYEPETLISKVSIWLPNHLIPGWAFVTPYSSRLRHTALGKVDIALIVVFAASLGSVFSSVNYVITYRYIGSPIFKNRRELRSFFIDALLVASRMMILANPALLIGILLLLSDRHLGTSVFDFSGGGDAILFQHLFWFFGHPEVYIIIIPCFGFMNSLLPYYLKKRLSGRLSLQFSMYTIAFMGFAVWGHHMYMVGLANSVRTLYSTMTVMISVPASTKVLHWCVTIINSTLSSDVGFLFLLSFMYFFVLGGLSGMFLAHIGFDVIFHDTFYVIGHFHVMLAGAAMSCIFAAFYFYFPSIFGVKYSRLFAYLHFTFYISGQLLTLIPMFWLGYAGMPRRIMDYPSVFSGWHSIISSGHILTFISLIFFLVMIFDSIYENRSPVSKNKGISRLNNRFSLYTYEVRKLKFNKSKSLILNNSYLFNNKLHYNNLSKLELENFEYTFLNK